MKKAIKSLLTVFLSGAIALAVLSGFCLVFNYSGCHITNQDGSTDYKWESNQYFCTMKEGFAWLRFDKNGFNNENDISFDLQAVDILLMGSSHMEAVQMKPGENTSAQLNKLLPEYRTYNIGISGHDIYTCIQNMKTASDQYKPKKYVVLETSDIQLSYELMKEVVEGTFPEIISHDSKMMYTIQKTIPAIKPLYKSIARWMAISQLNSNTTDSEADNDGEEILYESNEYSEMLELFLDKAASSVPAKCQLIIFYHPKTAIDENGNFKKDSSEEKRLFCRACEKCGIIFIDETNNFEELYNTQHVLAHGFSNTAVGAGHLNQAGHKVIAASLADIIKGREGEQHDAK